MHKGERRIKFLMGSKAGELQIEHGDVGSLDKQDIFESGAAT